MTKKKPAPITLEQTVSESLETILRHNFMYLLEWEQTARTWESIRGVHQMRVAFRRMRSALYVFRSALPRSTRKKWQKEVRYLASRLGRARDLDVLIDEGLNAVEGKLTLRGQEKLTALAYQHRQVAYEQVIEMLDSDRYATFKREFSAWINARQWEHEELKKKSRKNLSMNINPFSRKILDKLVSRALGTGDPVDQESVKDMHLLRIEFKKLRYAAEFFAPIIEGLDDFIFHLKKLQDLLGVMNDVLVMQGLLEHMLENETDHDLIEYAGGLVGWRTHEYYEMLDTFEDRMQILVATKNAW